MKMNKENKKFARIFTVKTTFYLWTILFLVMIIALLDYRLSIPGFVLFAFLAVHNVRSNYSRQKEITRYIENLTFNIETASKDTLLNFPLPLVVVELDGSVVWYNSLSRNIFGEEKLFEKNIDSLVKGLKPVELVPEQGIISRNVEINYRHYRMLGNFVKTAESSEMGSYILLLYFIDNTELVQLKDKYNDERITVGLVMIDNYDELMQSLEDPGPPQLLAEIEKRINNWLGFTDGIIKKIERDKYLVVMEKRYLAELEKRKFDILDDVKEINIGNRIPVTLSMGFGLNESNLEGNYNNAQTAIDISLARGGDQVVIKDGEIFKFYGGKTRELEKRTRVKARVIAYALRELIDQAERVVIMGHENGDVDSLGASLGVYRIAASRNKKAYIVLNKSNFMIDKLLKKLLENPEYQEVFLKKAEAMDMIAEKTLVIVVDTHRPAFTECPEILDMTDQVVVIDHHRRGAEFIKDPLLVYQETYASSTCEMVTELLQYVDDKIKITQDEADALLAGIVIDTKNFTFKTGVRTFEAASYLRRKGADTISIRYLFQDDLDTYTVVSNVVKNARILEGGIAISEVPANVKNQHLIAAKASDELLLLSGIEAAFVLCSTEEGVSISGRSLGDLNVQAILEKLGGGGHMSVAGAQLDEITMEEAKKRLEYAIIEYDRDNRK